MKIRSKLLIAFFILTILPLLLTLVSVNMIFDRQVSVWKKNADYNTALEKYEIFTNPINFFYHITIKDYEKMDKLIRKDPDRFLDKDFLYSLDKELQTKESYLIVLRNQKFFYDGNPKLTDTLTSLPIADIHHSEAINLTYLDKKGQVVIKEKTFHYSNNALGQVIFVTDFTNLQNRWIRSILELILAFFVILLGTGIVLSTWIYQSIIYPLRILQIATMQIGQGDLDHPLPAIDNSEIGQLFHDFEDMRIRLKDMVEQSILYEENTRDIMSSISHDLKTPITAIKGYTEGIIDGVADTEAKRQKYLETIYMKANDMTYLIDELLLFSKMERNSLAYHFIPINLEQYFADCIEEISFDLESANITLDYLNTLPKNTEIQADSEQLKRVINNIIGNSIKYMGKEHGHISIHIYDEPEKIEEPPLYRQIDENGLDLFPDKPKESFVRIEIRDNGIGIDEKDLPFVFDQFYRTDSSRNSSKGGSGLGLAIVKRIISDHGGEIHADSTLGVGTCLSFTLKKYTSL